LAKLSGGVAVLKVRFIFLVWYMQFQIEL
jgi:hypothetical protein